MDELIDTIYNETDTPVTFKFTRGDTFAFDFQLVDSEGEIIDVDANNCEIIFTVKQNYARKNFDLQKKLSNGTITVVDQSVVVEISPQDTDNMLYGDYVFDVEFSSGEYINTLIKGIIKLTEEVTTSENR